MKRRIFWLSFSILLMSGVLLGTLGSYLNNSVYAKSGDVFSASSTEAPIIDGIISTGEWADADSLTVDINGDNGDLHSLTIYVKNDATYLYLGVQVDDEYSNIAESGHDFLTSPASGTRVFRGIYRGGTEGYLLITSIVEAVDATWRYTTPRPEIC